MISTALDSVLGSDIQNDLFIGSPPASFDGEWPGLEIHQSLRLLEALCYHGDEDREYVVEAARITSAYADRLRSDAGQRADGAEGSAHQLLNLCAFAARRLALRVTRVASSADSVYPDGAPLAAALHECTAACEDAAQALEHREASVSL